MSAEGSANSLLAFVDSVSKASRLRVEDDLGDGFVRLRVSEAERRQAKQDIRSVEDAVIEMLRNARDAHATDLFLASSRSGNIRTLTLIDNGDGIPESMRDLIFEPRVTSKLDSMRMDEWGVHGRGMALYSIRQNAESAEVLDSVCDCGTSMQVIFDCAKLSERADQSTMPVLTTDDDGSVVVGSGPHNIMRTVAEFALSEQGRCSVYFGSQVDIAAALFGFGRRLLEESGLSPDADPVDDLGFQAAPPYLKLALSSDAAEFSQRASELGLSLSARSAYRIMQGQVSPGEPFLSGLSLKSTSRKRKKVDLDRDYRGLNIHADDLSAFVDGLNAAWAELAERYYLEKDVEPSVRVTQDGVHVTFPLSKQL